MIEAMETDKKDYLQIFELSKAVTDGKVFQKITHRQEQPEYEKSVAILANEKDVIEKKVCVIDDETHCTMLLAEEY